MYTNPG